MLAYDSCGAQHWLCLNGTQNSACKAAMALASFSTRSHGRELCPEACMHDHVMGARHMYTTRPHTLVFVELVLSSNPEQCYKSDPTSQ